MPLPRARKQQLVETNLQGLNIERGVLVRPANSFTKLENFDLVKNGVIRKVKGNKILTSTPAPSPIIGFRDYQREPSGPVTLVVVSSSGRLYRTGMSDPIALTDVDDLYDPAKGKLDEAPFIVSLPFTEYTGEMGAVKTVQYVVITVGDKDFPKYWDGNGIAIYNLGIPNPGDSYVVPFEHSVYIPMLFYTNDTQPNDPDTPLVILRGTSPNPEDGVNISPGAGRRYRASWYNPVTGHDSSLFPLSYEPAPLEDEFSGYRYTTSNTRPAGIVEGTTAAPYVMAIPLFLANLTDLTQFPIITEPQPGYTHIRFWSTRTGDTHYYLVPVIRDGRGKVVSDVHGAVDFVEIGIHYGVQQRKDIVPTPLFDGYIPLYRFDTETGFFAEGIQNWTKMIPYNWNGDYHVFGGGQTGSSLIVEVLGDYPEIMSGFFTLPNDPTMYRITDVSGDAPTPVLAIEPPLLKSPPDGVKITIMFIKPTMEADLVIQWDETTGANTDRQNDGPPKASWGTVYQNRLFLVDAEDKTRLVYSRIAHYEDFPPDNVFRFTQADYDPITAVLSGRQVGLVSEGADDRIVVGKQRSSAFITGTDDTNFAIHSLFSETGIVHKRAAIVIGGFLLAQSRRGLELFEGQRPVYIGSVIKDLIDNTLHKEYGPCFAMDRMENQILLGFQTIPILSVEDPPAPAINSIILMREPRYNPDGSLASPFSTITFPSRLGVMQESGFGNQVRMLAGARDGDIYQLFVGNTNADGSPVVATAETQLLPQDNREERKIFHRIQFEGNYTEAMGWKIQFEMDGNRYWTPVRKMYTETLIGLVGKQLKIRIIHDEVTPCTDTPMLSNFMLEYTPIGEAR
jgi:hypothetical protein